MIYSSHSIPLILITTTFYSSSYSYLGITYRIAEALSFDGLAFSFPRVSPEVEGKL